MIKKIVFLVIVLYQQIAFGLVTCSPTTCTPACGSSCTYYTCTQASSHSFSVNQLPFSDSEPADACAHTVQTANAIPFSVDGVSKTSLPVSVNHNYTVCEAKTNVGAACVANINCAGTWGACTGACGTTGSKIFTVTTPSSGTGAACPTSPQSCLTPACPTLLTCTMTNTTYGNSSCSGPPLNIQPISFYSPSLAECNTHCGPGCYLFCSGGGCGGPGSQWGTITCVWTP